MAGWNRPSKQDSYFVDKYDDSKTVSPVWNDGYQRYDLSIDEVIKKIKESGYNLDNLLPQEEEPDYSDSVYTLEIHSDRGTVVSPNIALTLRPRVLRDGVDITDETDMKHFKWVRSSSDRQSDIEWNLRHATGIKNLYITHDDVFNRAVFHCAYITGTAETAYVQNAYAAYMASKSNN